MSKLWLVGMTHNRINDFKEIIEYSNKYFDGLIFVDHYSSDGTYEVLESNKKNGKIIQRPYYMQHSHSQNEILFCRHAKNGDWMFLNDSPERIKLKWLQTIKQDIEEYEKQGIGAVCFSGRVYLWKYFDIQQFYGSPHWGMSPILGKTITFGEDNKNQYIENKRNEKPEESYCLHPIKYWFCHSPSNEIECVYGKYGQEILLEQKQKQFLFRLYCEKKLGLSLNSLDDLISYMVKIKNKEIIPDNFFIETVEEEFRLSELFQLKVLNMDFMKEIVPKRYKFSFKNYLNGGSGFPEGYESTIFKLNKQFGFPND